MNGHACGGFRMHSKLTIDLMMVMEELPAWHIIFSFP